MNLLKINKVKEVDVRRITFKDQPDVLLHRKLQMPLINHKNQYYITWG